MSDDKEWSDPSILEAIPNPATGAYEVQIDCPELSFLGVQNQPDFGHLKLIVHFGPSVIELKSLKFYLYDFRNRVMSYERLINTIYDDLVTIYDPKRLRIVMACNPRGGISSTMRIDSDWAARGGDELYKDWTD